MKTKFQSLYENLLKGYKNIKESTQNFPDVEVEIEITDPHGNLRHFYGIGNMVCELNWLEGGGDDWNEPKYSGEWELTDEPEFTSPVKVYDQDMEEETLVTPETLGEEFYKTVLDEIKSEMISKVSEKAGVDFDAPEEEPDVDLDREFDLDRDFEDRYSPEIDEY